MLGPFKAYPFESSIFLQAVNDFISKDEYLQEKAYLVYPNADDLVDLVKLKDQDRYLFKKDLKKAVRQSRDMAACGFMV